jgi:glyoxylase-like metal-dependent hydrolase (beta-lactamase superfamily II)
VDVLLDESQQTGEWESEGVYQVAEGVYRVPLPLPSDGLRAVNVYLVVHDDDVVIIDSGWADDESRGLLVRALSAIDLSPESISRFLVTHMHRDHFEQALSVRRDFGTRVALGRGEVRAIEVSMSSASAPLDIHVSELLELGAVALAEQVHQLLVNYEGRAALEYPDDWLEEGDIATPGGRMLTAVSTPGHTRGHFVFHDSAAHLLFAGDHVLPTITPSIGFEVPLSDNPLGDFLGSLARVRARADARLLPAHGPVAGSVHARIDELVEHHGRRLDQCWVALRSGGVTAFDVAQQLHWTRRERQFVELDVFNSMLAVSETGFHLALLVAQGRATVTLDGGVRHFTTV